MVGARESYATKVESGAGCWVLDRDIEHRARPAPSSLGGVVRHHDRLDHRLERLAILRALDRRRFGERRLDRDQGSFRRLAERAKQQRVSGAAGAEGIAIDLV